MNIILYEDDITQKKQLNMMKKIFAFLFLSILFVACDDSEDTDVLEVPDTYPVDFTTNPPAVLTAADNIGSISSKMKEADPTNGNNLVTAADLESIYTNGTPSLEDITTSYYDNYLKTTLFPEFAKAATSANGGAVIDFTDPAASGEGGSAYNHLLDEDATELEQYIEKALYGAAGFNYAVNTLLSGDLTTEDVNGALALYGEDGTLEKAKLTSNYANRRGMADDIEAEFLTLYAAVEQGFTSEAEESRSNVIEMWEKAIMAQTIHYMYATIDAFTGVNAGDVSDYETIADGIHAWSEAVGFLHGFYEVNGKIIADSDIESVLSKINAPINAGDNPITLINSVQELGDVQSAINDLATIYNFNDPESFR